jgi:hypothetical protein
MPLILPRPNQCLSDSYLSPSGHSFFRHIEKIPVMANTKNAKRKPQEDELDETTSFDNTAPKDGSASKRRKEKLTQDEDAYIEIPDVSDIPGQENIVNAGVPGAMADTTISSDDEEGIRDGKDILAEDDNVDIVILLPILPELGIISLQLLRPNPSQPLGMALKHQPRY